MRPIKFLRMNRLEEALDLLRYGVAVFPCTWIVDGACSCGNPKCISPGKHPLVSGGFKAASKDPEQIRAWFTEYPQANVAVATGSVSGIVTIDFDPKNTTLAALVSAVVRRHGKLPDTARVSTGRGGQHLHYRLPEGVRIPSSVGTHKKGLYLNVDVRGEGGYVLVPPSTNASGPYTWKSDLSTLADAPAWFVAFHSPKATPDTSSNTSHTFGLESKELLAYVRSCLETLGPAVEGQGGSNRTYAAASLVRHDYALSDDVGWELFSEWNETCDPPWSQADLESMWENAQRYAHQNPYGAARRHWEAQNLRPTIRIMGGKLADNASDSLQALRAASVPLYVRGGKLTRGVFEEVTAARGNRVRVAKMTPLNSVYLRDLFSRYINYERFSEKKGKWVAADPPEDVANTALARVGEWPFPTVVGVTTSPTMRPDGTILNTPGYDASTGFLLLDPPPVPDIPASPTREDATAALAALDALLDEFPFEDAVSRAVALSALITPVVRGAFPVSPGHAVTASSPASGKSFLFDVASTIATGQPLPAMSAGWTGEEMEKRLGAAVLSGQALLSLDNVNGLLGGDFLCQVIERPFVDVRVLGRSESVRVETRSTLFATGNNIQITEDLGRRMLLARLDAKMERPELRTFRGNPVADVLADRGRYIAAALTVCRAYAVAGRPGRLSPIASFEGWSDTVRSALVWLGRADPAQAIENIRSDDPALTALRNVLTTWHAQFQEKPYKASEICELADPGRRAKGNADFRDAIGVVAMNRGRLDAKTLGRWLGRNRGRIVSGFRLDSQTDASGHAARWFVAKVGGE